MKTQEIHILLFYKFVLIENPERFAKEQMKFCNNLGLYGKILVAHEGINGSVSGTHEQTEKYKEFLTSDSRFYNIVFKEEVGLTHPFTKMAVRVKEEIVSLKAKVDTSKGGEYITADELYNWYENKEDFVVLDARNDYEFKIGRFKNSIQVNTKTFREFPEAIKKLSYLKDKKIVTFCTGGIRCEKASALMKEYGFNNVYQLKDGIINFVQKYPNTYWEGKCFVFDKRLVTDLNQKDKPISTCEICGIACDLYRNCRNLNCDKLFISCVECEINLNGCCSKECYKEFKNQCIKKSLVKQGRRIVVLNEN